MAQKPVDKEVARRFAELVGRGLTQHEAARVVEIGTRTGERLMTKPEIRQIVEETRAACSGMGNGDPAIWALLEATDEEGNPDWERRAKGAELALDQLAGEGACGQSLHRGHRTSSRSAQRAASDRFAVGNSAQASQSKHPSLEQLAALW